MFFSFHIFHSDSVMAFKRLLLYCKSLLPTIGGLDPRVPPGSVLLYFFRSIVFSSTWNWKPFLPTIGGLDPRVPPGSVPLCLAVKLAPTD